jgi:hypothetical protein
MSESQRIYVIVARNLDLPNGSKLCMTSGRIAAHVAHAVLKMEECYSGDAVLWDCDIVILSVPNSSEFEQIISRLIRKRIPYTSYFDTGKLWQGELLTAVATFPIMREHGNVLGDLRPWKCACNEASKNDLRPRSSTMEQSVLTDRITAGRSSGAPDS